MIRPTQENYEKFMYDFSSQLSKRHSKVSFGYYGSYQQKTCVYGKADIDGFLVLDSRIITDETQIRDISQILSWALSRNRIKTQFNLLDRETIQDGRFLSYTKDYTDWLKKRAKILCGPNTLSQMNGLDPRYGTLHTAAFNFSGPRGVRNAVLYSLTNLHQSQKDFEEIVESAIDKVAKFPKKLIWLRTRKVITGRHFAQKKLETLLDSVNYDILSEINTTLDNIKRLDKTLTNPERALEILYKSLEVMEQMISSYTKRFPNISKKEVGILLE